MVAIVGKCPSSNGLRTGINYSIPETGPHRFGSSPVVESMSFYGARGFGNQLAACCLARRCHCIVVRVLQLTMSPQGKEKREREGERRSSYVLLLSSNQRSTFFICFSLPNCVFYPFSSYLFFLLPNFLCALGLTSTEKVCTMSHIG